MKNFKFTILFVTLRNLFDSSSVSLSNIALISGFLNQGHKVYILSPSINITRIDGENDNNLTYLNLGNNPIMTIIKKNNAPSFYIKLINLIRYFYYKFSIFDNSVYYLNRMRIDLIPNINFDFVISTSDPRSSHFYVLKLIKNGLKFNKWIQHWGDPLVDDITNKTILPKFILKKIEFNIIKQCSKVIYVSPLTLEKQKINFPSLISKFKYSPLPYINKNIYPNIKNNEIGRAHV
jgi:hypothetical protein